MRPTGSTEDGYVREVPTPPGNLGASDVRRSGRWGACAAAALAGVAVLLLVRTFVAEPVRIPTSSMATTLHPGEHVLVDKTAQVFRHWQRGDVVLFRAPDTGTLSIKRIVGLAGETVAIRDGHLFVDDDRVPEPYVEPGAIDSVYYGPRRVAEGQVLVFGDNRRNSRDSRDYGGVPISLVEGRITMILWPPGHAGGLR